MKVTLNAYRGAVVDGNGNVIGITGNAIDETNGHQKLTAAGSFAALPDETKYIRVATDTAIHIKTSAGAADTDPMMPANSVEYFGVGEGAVVSIITA